MTRVGVGGGGHATGGEVLDVKLGYARPRCRHRRAHLRLRHFCNFHHLREPAALLWGRVVLGTQAVHFPLSGRAHRASRSRLRAAPRRVARARLAAALMQLTQCRAVPEHSQAAVAAVQCFGLPAGGERGLGTPARHEMMLVEVKPA